MKTILLSIFCVTILLSCGPRKLIKHPASPKYEVVSVPMVVRSDTIRINELRFYEIESSMDAMQLLFDTQGKWNSRQEGRYQNNVPQLIWTNLQLIETSDFFTVSACGTETYTEYFAGIIILDHQNRDCLAPDHPLQKQLINYFTKQMAKQTHRSDFYQVLSANN